MILYKIRDMDNALWALTFLDIDICKLISLLHIHAPGYGASHDQGDLLPVLRAEQTLESLIQYIFSDYSLPITLEKTTKYSASVSQSYLICLYGFSPRQFRELFFYKSPLCAPMAEENVRSKEGQVRQT